MVLVCHPHPFIYLKTRKTGSSSVELALEPLCVPPGTEITIGRRAQFSEYGIVGRRGGKMRFRNWRSAIRPLEWRNHQSAAFVRRMLGKAEWDARPKITNVRDPFTRMVSHFLFESYRRSPQPEDFATVRDAFKAFLKSQRCRDDEEIVTLNGKYIIDHAIRMEHMREDYHAVAAKLGLPVKDEWLKHRNAQKGLRKGREPHEYYDTETIDIVRRRQAWVFENFDYRDRPEPVNEPAREVMT